MTSVYDAVNGLAQTRKWSPNFTKLPYPQEVVDRNSNLKAPQAKKGY